MNSEFNNFNFNQLRIIGKLSGFTDEEIGKMSIGDLKKLVKKLNRPNDHSRATRLVNIMQNPPEIKLQKVKNCPLVHLSMTSIGASGNDLIYLQSCNGGGLSKRFIELMRSSDFVPTTGVRRDLVFIIGEYADNKKQVIKKILSVNDTLSLVDPDIETLCLLNLLATPAMKELGLSWLIAFVGDSKYELGVWRSEFIDQANDDWLSSGGYIFVLKKD